MKKKILGYSIVSLPFVCFIVAMFICLPFEAAIAIFTGTVATASCFLIGAHLLG